MKVFHNKTQTIDIVSSQLYVCHILVSKKCQLQAGTIHPIGKELLTQQLTGSSTQTLARCVTIRCLWPKQGNKLSRCFRTLSQICVQNHDLSYNDHKSSAQVHKMNETQFVMFTSSLLRCTRVAFLLQVQLHVQGTACHTHLGFDSPSTCKWYTKEVWQAKDILTDRDTVRKMYLVLLHGYMGL